MPTSALIDTAAAYPSLQTTSIFFVVVLLVAAWSVVWKGLALWRAARLGSKAWFVVLLILNTAGILEILYLFVFSKTNNIKPTAKRPPTIQPPDLEAQA